MPVKKARVIITGRVQGVFFRANTEEVARSLGLEGWVRNRGEGTVEAVFQGEEDEVNEALQWCQKGPPYAMVTDVKVTYETPNDHLGLFTIVY